jgi:hypothetical protein
MLDWDSALGQLSNHPSSSQNVKARGFLEADFSGLKGRTLRLLSACTIFALAIESGDCIRYHRPHGKMHSTSTWPSHSERSRRLPRMRWPLWPLQRL